jgi:hypothetical protein
VTRPEERVHARSPELRAEDFEHRDVGEKLVLYRRSQSREFGHELRMELDFPSHTELWLVDHMQSRPYFSRRARRVA